jgi:hypothetical protein
MALGLAGRKLVERHNCDFLADPGSRVPHMPTADKVLVISQAWAVGVEDVLRSSQLGRETSARYGIPGTSQASSPAMRSSPLLGRLSIVVRVPSDHKI